MSITAIIRAKKSKKSGGDFLRLNIRLHWKGQGEGGSVREQGEQLLHQEGCMVAAHLSNFFFLRRIN